jgi:predicted DNA-binding antitoxin AbrB/MazE fold protein
MTAAIRTVEAVYEKGYLRPLAPIEGREGLVYIVTVVDTNAIGRKSLSAQSIMGKYRGRLSSSDEFARHKQNEKAPER